MKISDFIAFAALAVSAYLYSDFSSFFLSAYLCGIVFVVGRVWWSINIMSILAIMLLFKLIEIALVPIVWEYSNYVIYTTWFVLDLIIYFCIIFRAAIARKILGKERSSEICFTNADLMLACLALLHFVASLLSLIEHCLRHLDDFGLNHELSIVAWLNNNAVFIYYAYNPFKALLNCLEFAAVISTVTNYMRSARVLSV